MINGIINVYKEAGFTSHDVVAKLRGILKQKKIGHTGTLDPQAVGVLPVCLGNATKLCDILTDKTKEYEAVWRLGVTTDTQDMTGTVLQERPVTVTERQAEEALLSFVGEYMQVPPMYSALKVNGQKLCDLARQGREIERQARNVTIYEIRILEAAPPLIRFRVICSKGTYIRTLCHDAGEKLGCGGAMESLKRTGAGSFRSEDALTLAQIEELRDNGKIMDAVFPVEKVFEAYDRVFADSTAAAMLQNGNVLNKRQVNRREKADYGEETFRISMKNPDNLVRMYDAEGSFYGVYEYLEAEGLYKPYKMFLPDKEQ